ncbi:M28 family peptidase [Sphingomicrobium flavum]|uniref:M28 family peptidase n=1 Tax=Sphingomicrobium flavum TaxID=1229164 RepID=UPI0021ADA1A5|nr:M28 family peptidase [Sphingomicrobium flavum]
MRLILAAAALALTATPAFANDAEMSASADEVRAHVEFLADDLLEGRGNGQRGYDLAALYVAAHYRSLGLEPAGDNGGWFQDITFRRAKTTGQTIELNGEEMDGVYVRGNVLADRMKMDAPLVFVGYGLEAGPYGHDSYAGIDVKGKIAVAINAMPDLPKGLNSDIPAHLGASREASAAKHGAVGLITIGNDRYASFFGQREVTGWVDQEGRSNALPGDMKVKMVANGKAADALFAGSGRDFDELRDAAREGKALQSFDLPGTISITATSEWEEFTAANVVGKLPGSDEALDDEYVVLSAHLDHLGIREGMEGDNIFNGALDNASGIATMLEAGRLFANNKHEAGRSVLFMALAAEELGLQGADYYAINPTVPLDAIVANVNLDMPVPLYDFNDVTAFGASHNTVGEAVARAGAEIGISLSPDPMPEQAIFTRSDHYKFAQRGIPSVLLFTGYGNGGEDEWTAFFAQRYHRAGDDLSQDINWTALARYAELNYRIARQLASDAERPKWYEGNFFGDLFAPGKERATP